MDNPTTIISQNVINVDIDSRAVTLPVNFNLGVMYDNSCKTITFKVKKKSDITDLTDLTFSINTISAKGKPDKLECDTREEGSFYIITAVLKGTIFEASGKATFNLCGQKFDSSHVVIKAWGSEDITALVGEHSHADKAIEELYPSVLEELKQKVNNPNLTEEQLNTIAQKVAEKGFYTKSEVDSLINAKPTITVDTELNETSNNPIANKAVFSTLNTMSANFESELAEKADKTELETYATTNDLDKKADKFTIDTELKEDSNNPVTNKAITNAINSKADKFTVDTVVSATSDNPVSSKAVSTSLNALSNEIGEGIEAQLAEKADKADLDKKVNKSDVVTNVDVEGIETNTNPIATSVVYNKLTSFYSEFEAKHVEMHSKFNLVGLDTNTLYVITKALNDELNFSEFWFVFYGRENDKDDTLTNGDGNDGIYINDTRVLARPLVYIRKSGTYFYTVGHFKTVGEFVFGTVSRCDGNGTTSTYTVEPIQATKVDSITIVTNNLFKGDSKFAVYAR